MRDIWLRHHNGNGKKYGNDAEVSPDTFLDRTSVAGDRVEVYGSQVLNYSTLTDDTLVINSVIKSSTLAGACRIINSTVEDVELRNVRVTAGAHLIGPWALDECVRIDSGIWRKPPRFYVVKGINIRVVLSECTEDRYHLGCWCLTYDKWTREGYRQMLGKYAGWTPAQIEKAFDTFTAWRS
jgi:hypothetical protein